MTTQAAVFQRKILGRIFYVVKDGDTWKSEYNEELYELYRSAGWEIHIRFSRLRFLEHVNHMLSTKRTNMFPL